jgi:glycosyltransferase involved in cell wall biosynthesis
VARICVIRQYYYPVDVRVRRELQALAAAGYDVDIICVRRAGELRLERQGRITIHRFGIPSHRRGQLQYLLQYAAFFAVAAVVATVLHLRHRYELVQVNTMPDGLVFAALVPRLLGARILLDLHECMPEFYAVKFGKGLDHPVVRMAARLEQAAIRFADHAITCTDQMRDAIAARGVGHDRLDVIVNSANEEEFDPGRYPDVDRQPGAFRIICHGAIEHRYGIDTIVRAVALLAAELPGLRADIYGEGSAVQEVRALIRELGVGDRITLPGQFVPMDQVLRAIAAADAGVVAIRRDIFRDLTLANKMFEYIAMRKPAIVSRTRSVEAYFGDFCFEMFESGDAQDLAGAIRRLYRDPERRAALVSQASRVADGLRWSLQRERYLGIVGRLIRQTGAEPVAVAQTTAPGPN